MNAGSERVEVRWLLPALVLVGWLSFLAFVLPYDPDEAAYKIIATGIVRGDWPYRDLFDHKPPLLYAWYLPTGLGATIEAQRVIAALVVGLSVPLLAAIATRWLDHREALLATWAYVAFLANPYVAIGANAEAFMLLPITVMVAAGAAPIAGAALGVATLTKPVAIAFLPLLVARWGRHAWQAVVAAALVVSLAALPFLPVWSDFWDANVSFNLSYGRHTELETRLILLLAVNPLVLLGSLPVWFAAVFAVRREGNSMLLLWVACALMSVKLTGFDFGHYYALLAPPLALLAGAGLTRILRRRRDVRFLVASSLVAVVLAGLGFVALAARDQQPMLRAIRENPGEVYVLGDRTNIYAEVGRHPSRRFFYSVPLVVRPEWGAEVRDQLHSCLPDVLVIPDNVLFPVPWADDMARDYEVRQSFETGVVLTKPRWPCAVPLGER